MGIFQSIFHSRDKPKNRLDSGFGRFLFGFGTASGKSVTERTAMQTTAVFACVKVISETVASLPIHVFEEKANGDKIKAVQHPLYRLLHLAPNNEMTAYTFIETALSHLLIYGNFYAQIIRDGRGYPVGLYPLLPCNMDVTRKNGELVYTYQSDGGAVKMNRWTVLHVPGLGFDGVLGYSPIALAKNSIGMALATEEYGSTFFKNGANPGGVLEFPNTVKDIKRLKETWNAGYQGSDNAHRVAILEEGAKFNPVSIPPNEAQFLETRRYQLEEIARVYRVPLHLVGDLEHATFSNIEHQSLSFVKFTLTPWVRRLEQVFETALLPPGEQGRFIIKFSIEGLLRGDFKSRYEGYAVGIRNGWLSVNDVRALEELNLIPADEGGDSHFVNGAAILLKDIGAPYLVNENTNDLNKEDRDDKQT